MSATQTQPETEMPATELLKREFHSQERMKKSDFIEKLRHKRLLCLDRAAVYEELIQELGGSLTKPDIEDVELEGEFAEQGSHHSRRRNREETDDEGNDQNNNSEATRKDGGPDHRFKGNETQAISDARHMRHGDDGRGEVTDPENDKRLKQNLSKRGKNSNKEEQE